MKGQYKIFLNLACRRLRLIMVRHGSLYWINSTLTLAYKQMVWDRIFLLWKFSHGHFWWLSFSANKAVLERLETYFDRSGSRILQKGGSDINTNRLPRICYNIEGILSHFHLQIFHFKLTSNETSIKKHLNSKITRIMSTVLKQFVQKSRDFGLVWSQLCHVFLIQFWCW